MLALIRRFAKSPAATVLLGLLLASFAVFGIGDVFKSVGRQDTVVDVAGRTVTANRFKSMFDRYLKGAAQQAGKPAPTIQEAAAQGLDVQALNEISYEEAMGAAVARSGVRPGDELVAAELRKAPRFFNSVTGVFDKKLYQAFLRENDTTSAELEGNLRDQIAQRHFLTGLVAAMQAPKAFTLVQATFNGETRDFDAVSIPASAVPTPPKPTDAELTVFMKENAAQLTRPETRTVSLVRFSAAALAPTVAIDPAEVKKRFDFERDTLSTPEKRSVVQIPLKSAAQAGDVIARLKRGEAPAAVAKSVSAVPVLSEDAPKTAIPDPVIGQAAFAMAQGEVKGPVAGKLGLAVVQVLKITPGHEATLDEVRPKIEAEVRKAAATEKADELAQKYDDARNGGSNLAEAATKAGVPVTQLPPFTATGVIANGQPLPVPKKLVATAYQLAKGGESELLQAGPGESYAIRVDAVAPAAPLTLEEIRAPLTARLMQQKLGAALAAKGEAVAAEARKKGSLEGLAGAVQHVAGVDRAMAQRPQSPYPPQLLAAVFGAKPGQVLVAPGQGASVAVVRVTRIAPPSPDAAAQASRAAHRAATLGVFDDLAAAAREYAHARLKPKIDVKRAKTALGLDPDAKAPAAPALAK